MANDIIPVKKRGSFHVGGERTVIQGAPVEDLPYFGTFTFHSDPNGTHWTKQMYVQYTELAGPKAPYPILMWHGGGLTGVTWETTPDGREGWDTLFLRMRFDVYVSDAVERGRASWAKFPDVNPTPPIFHSYESRWLNLKMGAVYPEPYEGQRFPVRYYDQLMMQGVPRWMTSDEWTQAAYDKYLERLQKTLPGVILMAHSQGCTFALNAARKCPDFVKALVLVECASLPDSNADIAFLKDIPQLYVYGDFMEPGREPVHSWVAHVRNNASAWRSRLEATGADYTWMSLPELGIRGNSHMLMMDNNSADIAELIHQWLIQKGLGVK